MPTSNSARANVSWRVIALVWTAYALIVLQHQLISEHLLGMRRSYYDIAVPILTSAAVWALMTPVVLWFYRAVRSRVTSSRLRWLAWAGGFVAIHTIDSVADYARSHLLLYGRVTFGQTFWVQALLNLVIYSGVLFVAHVIDERRRLREEQGRTERLEAQLAQAELAALRTQLQPHFLFNTLNAISELVHHEPEVADLMTIRLGHLLRVSLDHARHAQVTLGEELRFLEMYLDIQRARLGDSLRVTIDVPDDARDALVPTLSLQPLVENAIRHGMGPDERRIDIAVSARAAGDRLDIRIEDGGRGLSQLDTGETPAAGGGGIGVRNVRAALERLHAGARLTLEPRQGGGTSVRIDMPRIVHHAIADERAAS